MKQNKVETKNFDFSVDFCVFLELHDFDFGSILTS